MPNVITGIAPTTELDAVNVILGSIGEAPLPSGTDLSTTMATDGNVEMAVTLLRESTREVLTAGWRFNTLTGWETAPTATYNWQDSDAVVTTLNIFKKPTNALAWKQTACSENSGIELVERPSLAYVEGGNSVLILFDRIKNRDGAEKTRYPFVYLDVVTTMDFEQMPESARRVATTAASIRMAERLASSEAEAQFSQRDLSQALRVLRREQGLTQNFNLFQTGDAIEIGGRRWFQGGGGFNARVYPGGRN